MLGKIVRGLTSWVGILVLLLVMQLWISRDMVTGKPPEIQGTLITGERFAGLEGMPKPVVVYFWAGWCSVCKAMQPVIRSLSAEGTVLTVAMQSGDATTVSAYMSQHDLHATTMVDEDGSIAKRWGIHGVPALFVIDREGNIRYSTRGYTSFWGLKARLWLAGLAG